MKKISSPMIDKIKKGAALLDKKIPGWEEKQDLSRFNMKSGCSCVLGWSEEERDYWITLRKLFPDVQSEEELYHLAYEYGFNIKHVPNRFEVLEEEERYYASLAKEWKKFIKERRLQHVSRAD